MTAKQRREQLIAVGRTLFAERGFDGASVEEVAARAGVTKPVVYEHFGGKEGLYAVVVDREMQRLEEVITQALSHGRSRARIEQAVIALLTYVEEETDAFQILVRDMMPGKGRTYSTLLNDAVVKVTEILSGALERSGLDTTHAVLQGQALVGMVASTAQWWLEEREYSKEEVATHIVNLCWNGLGGLEAQPALTEVDATPLILGAARAQDRHPQAATQASTDQTPREAGGAGEKVLPVQASAETAQSAHE